MAKHCAYCDRPIHGEALPISDGAASGVHIPAYWHADPAECGPMVASTSPLDTLSSPVERHIARAMQHHSP
ncbi:hypothetical protein ACFV9D_28605 [Streptomyces sp. NPDC059875]|uniref:hypothetical protein n=1 Tax=unclassified Streptomyces TaxID=2593676 RepID=UPI00364FA6F9